MKNKKGTDYKPYQEQDQVWLEATNLKTTHPTAKLAPKQYSPFTIIKKVSDAVFQLELPYQWKIHNMFHTSLLTTVEDDNELEYEEDPRSKQMSPTRTENIHPGYPYRENIGDNDDLPKLHYSHPYLAAQVDYVTGDPRIRGKDEKGNIPYDEGTLTVNPFDTVPEDIEDKVATYPFGEDAYLDTDFLQAIGNLDDRGLAAESLRLVQIQGEFRHLEQWQRRLEKREQAIHLERGDLIQKKQAAHTRQTDVYKRLRAAKAASRIAPRLIAQPEGPSLAFPHPTRPYQFPPKPER
jgi:hypothetical protein